MRTRRSIARPIAGSDSVRIPSPASAATCLVAALALLLAGCVRSSESPQQIDAATDDAGSHRDAHVDAGHDAGDTPPPLPYASEIVAFDPGDGAGWGESDLPGVVTGPPDSTRGTTSQGLDVLSLGDGGTIVVGFGSRTIHDGEGVDFVVFENPFYVGGDRENVYAELGEVSVSRNGDNWKTFPCDSEPTDSARWPGCAGWRPTREFDPEAVGPPDPAITGGNGFDLADVGLERANYVRIRDLQGKGKAPKVGFDLDAVGISHPSP